MLNLNLGDVILTTHVEYGANFVAILQRCKHTGTLVAYAYLLSRILTLGATYEIIPQTDNGVTSIEALESILKRSSDQHRVKLIVLTWIPTNGGVVNPAEAVGRLAAQYHVLYLLDACQACGQLDVDVKKLKCHFLTATGRKFLRAPRGTGFLYVSSEALSESGLLGEPASLDHTAATWVSRDQYVVQPSAKRYEQWEVNVAAFVGLNRALEYYLDDVGPKWVQDRICATAKYLREKLRGLNRRGNIEENNNAINEGPIVLTDLGFPDSQCGLVSFYIRGVDSDEALTQLFSRNIYFSVTHPVSTLIDATNRNLVPLLRASVHYFNTFEEVDHIVDIVATLIPLNDSDSG